MERREFLRVLGLAPAAVAALGVPLPKEDDGMVMVTELWTTEDVYGCMDFGAEILGLHPTMDGMFVWTTDGLWIVHTKDVYAHGGLPFVKLKLSEVKEKA